MQTEREGFYQHVFRKLVSFTVSLKVHILTLTTILLVMGKINEQTWSTVIIAIALGRIAIQGVAVYNEKKPLNHASKHDTLG